MQDWYIRDPGLTPVSCVVSLKFHKYVVCEVLCVTEGIGI